MGGKSDDNQVVTQRQELPPQINGLLSLLANETNALANYTRPSWASGGQGATPYGSFNPYGVGGGAMPYGGSIMPIANGGPPPQGPSPAGTESSGYGGLVPDLSSDTLRGLDMLRGQFQNNPGMGLVNSTIGGAGFGANPALSMYTKGTGMNTATGVNPAANMPNPYANSSNPYLGVRNKFASMTNDNTGAVAVGSNPVIGNNYDDVANAIQASATKAVGDRFSQAGRGGSRAEFNTLGTEVAKQLAPYAYSARDNQLDREFQAGESGLGREFAANTDARNLAYQSEADRIARMTGAEESRLGRDTGAAESRINRIVGAADNRIGRENAAWESALARRFGGQESSLARMFDASNSGINRQFSAYEAERARQLGMLPQLFGLQSQDIQNYLNAGQITEDQQRQLAMEPFQRLQLLTGPIGTAISGAPMTSTTTQPLNRNVAGGALGGALGGAQLGSLIPGLGTGIGAGIGGLIGLLG